MKGIILAAGRGTRLFPATLALSKPMLPVYDRPMVYYPMASLLSAGVRDIMIISSIEDVGGYKRVFGDGSDLGIKISYAIQNELLGIADAFIIAEGFIGDDDVCLALGDNIFLGEEFYKTLEDLKMPEEGAIVFGYWVEDPRPFGVVEFDEDFKVLSLEEKPERPKSNYIVPGLYFYDNKAARIAAGLEPSARGELEITDVNKVYLEEGTLEVRLIDKSVLWFDAGSAEGMLKASNAAAEYQKASGDMLCIEEIAWKKGLIDDEGLRKHAELLKKTEYGKRLLSVLEA